MSWPDSRLWPAALDLYGRPGVAEACLDLQDRHGIDVDMVLVALWLAGEGAALDRARVKALEQAVERFRHEVVVRLRDARRALKRQLAEASGPAGRHPELARALRERLQSLEIDLERLELLTLEALTGDLPRDRAPGRRLALANLESVHPAALDAAATLLAGFAGDGD
jgi:uncharacterized protein (TIGR02444 family)